MGTRVQVPPILRSQQQYSFAQPPSLPPTPVGGSTQGGGCWSRSCGPSVNDPQRRKYLRFVGAAQAVGAEQICGLPAVPQCVRRPRVGGDDPLSAGAHRVHRARHSLRRARNAQRLHTIIDTSRVALCWRTQLTIGVMTRSCYVVSRPKTTR